MTFITRLRRYWRWLFGKRRLLLANTMTDDQTGTITVQLLDKLGVPEPSASFALTASVDNDLFATAAVSASNPAQVIVTPVAPPSGTPEPRTVNVTIADGTSGLSGSFAIEIGPGAAASLGGTFGAA
jgi:hypothetical protein